MMFTALAASLFYFCSFLFLYMKVNVAVVSVVAVVVVVVGTEMVFYPHAQTAEETFSGICSSAL